MSFDMIKTRIRFGRAALILLSALFLSVGAGSLALAELPGSSTWINPDTGQPMPSLAESNTWINPDTGQPFPSGTSSPPAAEGGGQIVTDPANIALQAYVGMARAAEFAASNSLISSILAVLTTIVERFVYWMEETIRAVVRTGSVISEAIRGIAINRTKLTEAIMDADALNTRMEVNLKHQLAHMPPAHEFLCNSIMMDHAITTAVDHSRSVARMVQTMLVELGRERTDDMSGIKWAMQLYKTRCALGFGNAIDGDDAECVSTRTAEPGNRSFADADLSPAFLDGSVDLEVADMREETYQGSSGPITAQIPSPSNAAQYAWLAGVYFCVQLQGPRVTPRFRGEDIPTPSGLVERAQYETAASLQSAMNKPCSDLLGYYSRPNPTMAASLIRQQNEDCEAARGTVTEETLNKKFGGCTKGLSQYQAEHLSHLKCKTSNYYTKKASAGGTHDKMTDDIILCDANWNLWMTSVAKRHGKLVDSVMGQLGVKGKWPDSTKVRKVAPTSTSLSLSPSVRQSSAGRGVPQERSLPRAVSQ
ncbi:MAG: hypothetical protein RBT70_05930 [Alphaproteobacteria bacterium]|jgi:hypothetical protein|nr:hypothetical protein [Alphaproteobacteria bacterium]